MQYLKPISNSTAAALVCAAFLLLPCLRLGAQSGAEYTVTGHIFDSETKAPLYLANVFLSNTTWGAASDENGAFRIDRVKPGVYQMVITMMGYEKQVRPVVIPRTRQQSIPVFLKPTVYNMESVAVEAEVPREWHRHLDRFKREFLGMSVNAQNTIIENPEVLDFSADRMSGLFRAVSAGPLHVENNALGYRITFFMQSFNAKTAAYLRYTGEARFIPMDPPDKETQALWEKNRRTAYEGSIVHFFKSALQGRSRREGFFMYILEHGIDTEMPDYSKPVLPDTLILPGKNPHEFLVFLPKYAMIIYNNENEPETYKQFIGSDKKRPGSRYIEKSIHSGTEYQISYVSTEFSPLTVYETGHLYTPDLFSAAGYWTWERIADMLPLNYEPPQQNSRPSAEQQ